MFIGGGKVVLPDHVIADGAVVIDEATGRVEDVGSLSALGAPRSGEIVLDASGAYVAPGFIDLHCHGGWGADFMDGTPEAFDAATAFHALHGTTSLLATSTSADLDVILQMLGTARGAMSGGPRGSRVLGVHLEGPWLNRDMRGCHLERHVRPPTAKEWNALVPYLDAVRLVTLSPEVEGCMDLARELRGRRIVVAAGHSASTYDEMMVAIEAGVRHVSHIFCAMSTTVRIGPWRHPGVLETALVDDRLTTDMIADGKHLPAPLMRLAYRCKGPDGLCLVSDAMRGAGLAPGGKHTFGPRDGTEVVIDRGVAMLPDRTVFASSITPLDAMVRNVVEMVGAPIHEAIRMASLTPAKIIGLDGTKGSLEPGKDADVVILDEELRVMTVIIGGRIVAAADLAAAAPPDAQA